MPKINVIAIGGRHQFPHFLPVAFEIAKRGADVEIFVGAPGHAQIVRSLAERLGYPAPQISVMTQTWLDKLAQWIWPRRKARKWPRLLKAAIRLRNADAIICAERTSSILKRLPGNCPVIIHFRHGAGDRAVGFDKRISRFDHLLTIGPKDRDRTVAEGLLPPERCHIGGAIKIASILLTTKQSRLFDNDRPVVLFNPHFDPRYSSFDMTADRLIASILSNDKYNLVIAPHVRLVEQWHASDVARWESRSVAGRVIVDMGSPRSIDMSYTLGADLYLGDVSSQVYEFILRPRPCLFIDTHARDWRDDPNYAMWHMGPVVNEDDDLRSAIDHAFATFGRFQNIQETRARAAFGSLLLDVSETRMRVRAHGEIARAADVVLDLVAGQKVA